MCPHPVHVHVQGAAYVLERFPEAVAALVLISLRKMNTVFPCIQGGRYVLERFPEAVAPLILIFKKIYFIFIS